MYCVDNSFAEPHHYKSVPDGVKNFDMAPSLALINSKNIKKSEDFY
jgi:hypothetical protein